ncbi:Ig-like domain-containing protein [Fictibacillus phosphorivorans]|uniref:Ig-like domain-containing protein n=1 Tax=Fictibacillus phosphorivorans TaxID=1221500 RepID=UPI0016425058|nr:Ig-like domain-containing protein [Fictibacillus phosphorivorans]
MKKILVLFIALAIVLQPFLFSGSVKAEVQNTYTLSQGTYTVGNEMMPGIHRFTAINGDIELRVTRDGETFLYQSLEAEGNYEISNYTVGLRDGDQVEVYSYYTDDIELQVQKLSQLNFTNMTSGYYEIGKDIAAGTYTIDVQADNPDYYDFTSVQLYDKDYNDKASYSLTPDDQPVDLKVSNGDILYIHNFSGTVSFKQKILVPKSISFNKTSLSLMVNRSESITATVHPITAVNRTVSWVSSDPSVATIDSKGNVKALKPGSTVITATAKGDSSIQKSIKVNVNAVLPTSLKLSKSKIGIVKNQTYNVVATVNPSDVQDKSVIWSSSNTKVATVDAKGNIKGVGYGSATVVAKAKANQNIHSKVTVTVSAKTVKLNKTALTLTAGTSAAIAATVSPTDSPDKTVTWKSSNTKIATVNSKGSVTGKAKGTATITATVKGAKSVTAKVTVKPPVLAKSIKVNKSSVTLASGKSVTLSATVSPSNTTNKNIKWKTSNTKVAKVDSKGKVTAVGAGTAKITATTSNGKTSSATINVPYVKSLSAGKWKGGTHLPAGRYRITTDSGSGNLVIGMGTDRFVNEVLTSEDDEFAVRVVTTDIKAGDSIEIMGLYKVTFTKVTNVKSNTLHAGYWTVGKDINEGTYRITTPSGAGNLVVHRGYSLVVNEILAAKSDGYSVTSVTVPLKKGDRISIYGLNKVVFTKK